MAILGWGIRDAISDDRKVWWRVLHLKGVLALILACIEGMELDG